MKGGREFAISAIAWNPGEEVRVAELMAAHGFSGVELAPGKLFARPEAPTAAEIAGVRSFWETRGIRIVALQALLFGHPELTLFQSAEARKRMREYLAGIIRTGAALGAQALVFGSPKNRARGALPLAEAQPVALDFFGALGEVARSAGTCLCLEPNPVQYGADFCTDSVQALELVAQVGSPGFGLHLDTACALLAGEEFPERVRQSAQFLRHVHFSEPELAPVGPGGTLDARASLSALSKIDYQGAISIEMRAGAHNLPAVERALGYLSTLPGID